ncbi:hypothetical protein FOA52_006433 [Chlamydomonas sp. UWO 241]|nr:hypothetical protein FOA52_006433 [Chlamydomonas sp. UWO 241]
MKFCHLLEKQSAGNERYTSLFLFYKKMKKSLKLVPAANTDGPADGDEFAAAEDVFVDAVIEEIGVLGRLRATTQANSASQLAHLKSVVEDGDCGELEGRQQVYQDLVNFHGETLLLLHWSILAYTAIVKLLKKHQKRTGTLLQAPHLRDMLAEESWSTEPPTALIATAAALISQVDHELYSSSGSAPSPDSVRHSSNSPTSR